MEQFDRTEKLIGNAALQRLARSHVAVFGLGGVGGFAVEALARAGVGKLTLVDFDTVDETNINRQLFALHSTLGKLKTDVAKQRVADINPNAAVFSVNCRFDAATSHLFDFTQFDYVIDAVDTVTAKLLLAEICSKNHVPIISSMGTGNKLDPTLFKVADIFQTKMCPLAKVMRRELKKRGIDSLKVVYSEEQPIDVDNADASVGKLCADAVASNKNQNNIENSIENAQRTKATPASISFVPPVAGMILAGEAVKDIIANA